MGVSLDEQYWACLVESVVAGSTDPERIRRTSVANTLRRSRALRARLEAAKTTESDHTRFHVEPDRVRNVLVKLARGHAAFELSMPCREEPNSVGWWPLILMPHHERESFEACHFPQSWGEVGSRGMQRVMVTELVLRSDDGKESVARLLVSDWVHVQDGRYRYHAIHEGGEVMVKIVIGDYLAAEVVWGDG